MRVLEGVAGVVAEHLKVVRDRRSDVCHALIPDFAEDELVEFVKGFGRIALTTCPERVVGLFENAREFVFLDHVFSSNPPTPPLVTYLARAISFCPGRGKSARRLATRSLGAARSRRK
jgi:hypothetical protein